MRHVSQIAYQPRGTWSAVCLPITEAQGRTLYPVRGLKCFDTYADAAFFLITYRKPGQALMLASILEMGGYCVIGHAQL